MYGKTILLMYKNHSLLIKYLDCSQTITVIAFSIEIMLCAMYVERQLKTVAKQQTSLKKSGELALTRWEFALLIHYKAVNSDTSLLTTCFPNQKTKK